MLLLFMMMMMMEDEIDREINYEAKRRSHGKIRRGNEMQGLVSRIKQFTWVIREYNL